MLNLCRLCLSDQNLIDVHNKNLTQAKKIRQLILEATNIEIKIDDVTTAVCEKCCLLVSSIHNFRKTAIVNNAAIQKHATEVFKGALESCVQQLIRPEYTVDLELPSMSRSSSEQSLADSLNLQLSSEPDITESDEMIETDIIKSAKLIDEQSIVIFDAIRPECYEFSTSEQKFVSRSMKKHRNARKDIFLSAGTTNIDFREREITFPNSTTTVVHDIAKDLRTTRVPVILQAAKERDVRCIEDTHGLRKGDFRRKLPQCDWTQYKVQRLI